MVSRKAAAKELLERRRAKHSMLHFTTYTKPNYEVNWHHKSICEKLDKFTEGSINRMMIFVPPQHGKSELSSRRLPAYLLGKKPDTKIALCSYGADHAQSFNRDVQRVIDDNLYSNIFPKTTLNSSNVATTAKKGSKRTSNIFEIVGFQGFMKTVGVGGGLTGTTVDVGIIDDPFKDREEANSQRVRDKVWNWYTDVFESRLHNDSQQLIVLTRWHEDDLAGRILDRDGDEWEVVVYEALKESEPNEYDRRGFGEALWESKHSRSRLEKIRDNSPRTFTSLYQQRPSPEKGNIIQRDWFIIKDEWDLDKGAILSTKRMAVDTADKTKQENDPSAYCVYSEYKNKVIIWSYWEGRLAFPARNKKFEEGYREYECRMMKIEPKSSGVATVQHLKENSYMNVIEAPNPEGDKMARLKGISEEVESGRVILVEGNWNEKFITSIISFPSAKHDEPVDVLVMAVNDTIKGGSRFGGLF